MSCCGVKIEEPRNADLRRTYTPPAGYSFSNFTALMQVRLYEGAPGPSLLEVSMVPAVNGSVFTITGSSLILTIKKEDLELLPQGDPVDEPAIFVYDIILTDQYGFRNKFIGGPFIVYEGVAR